MFVSLSEIRGDLVATMRVNLLVHRFVCYSSVAAIKPLASWKILHSAVGDMIFIE